mmetsp:Transcript_38154/g.85040  ORF Transcript_38154/g.85040 Transcript_38154/m.85040 type:complete len:184 (+) Transcript_38154:317-868(+)
MGGAERCYRYWNGQAMNMGWSCMISSSGKRAAYGLKALQAYSWTWLSSQELSCQQKHNGGAAAVLPLLRQLNNANLMHAPTTAKSPGNLAHAGARMAVTRSGITHQAWCFSHLHQSMRPALLGLREGLRGGLGGRGGGRGGLEGFGGFGGDLFRGELRFFGGGLVPAPATTGFGTGFCCSDPP